MTKETIEKITKIIKDEYETDWEFLIKVTQQLSVDEMPNPNEDIITISDILEKEKKRRDSNVRAVLADESIDEMTLLDTLNVPSKW